MEPKGARRGASPAWIAPSSDNAYSAPSIQARRWSATHCAPNRLPASSSAVARKMRSRLSGTLARTMARKAASWTTPVDFMSRAPRPYT
jgi:hypothetical protein